MVNDEYFERIAQIESNGDPFAENPNSSAKGKYQFIDSTAKQYGITAEFGTPEYTQQEEQAVRQLTADNYRVLAKGLNREPTQGELYLAHQQGAGGALKLLNSNNKAVNLVGRDEIELNRGDENMTGQEFARQWTNKFDGKTNGGEGQSTFVGGQGNDAVNNSRLIKLPDGRNIVLTGQETPEQLSALKEKLRTKYQANTDEGNVFQRIGDDYKRRNEEIQQTQLLRNQGEITGVEEGLRLAGDTAGFALDAGGEVINAGARGVANLASKVTPDFIENPLKQIAGSGSDRVKESALGQAVGSKINLLTQEYADFKNENPRAAKNIESVANVGLLMAPVKSKPKVSKPTVLKSAADDLNKAGVNQLSKQRANFADDLILPKQTAKIRADQVGRTTETGFLRSKKLELDPVQRRMADEVAKLPIEKGRSLQYNYNVIQKEVFDEAKVLESALKTNEVIFPRKEFLARLDSVKSRLQESPNIVGDSATTANKIMNKFEKILSEKPSTGSGLLQARKELDQWIRKEKPRAFDVNKEGAFEIALRDIRNATNNFIDEKAVNVAVKDSLRKQSSLYGALDNIAPKAALEGSNAIKRLWSNVTSLVPVKGEAFQGLAALGLAGIATKVGSPLIALGISGLSTYKIAKAIGSPKAKKELAKLLDMTDQAIRVTKDKQMIQKLRADRALVVELLEQEEE